MIDDLISRSEAKKLGATCLARRNENGQLEAIISLDNAPTVEPEKAKESELIKAYTKGFDTGVETVKNERQQGKPTYVSDIPDDKVKDLQVLAIDYGEGIAVFERKRPRGEWKETDIPESVLCKCSVCGFDLGAYSFNFCPNCGADMKGAIKDE